MTPEKLQEGWNQLNACYFRSALPTIQILWSGRLTSSAGMFISRIGPRARRHGVGDGEPIRLIRLSWPLLHDQPEQEIVGTLAHEMIHQWQYDILKRRPNHGPDFYRMMQTMNRHGLGITIRHTLDRAVESLSKYEWRCQQCGRHYRRQRRTIRPGRHRCGACRGKLKEIPATDRSGHPVVGQGARPTRRPATEQGGVQLDFNFSIS